MNERTDESKRGDSQEPPAVPAPAPNAPRSPTSAGDGAPAEARRGAAPPESPHFDWRWLVRIGVQAAVLLAVGVGLIVLAGVAQRVGWISAGGGGAAAPGDPAGDTVYTCPMHPQIRQNEPGKCPICAMDLVPASRGGGAGERGGDGTSIHLEPVARRLAGIRTAPAKYGRVDRTIRTIGSIEYDESRLATISAYVEGRLEQLYADYVGVAVRRNDDLALIYSPQLYSAQVEFLTSLEDRALRRLGSGNDSSLAEMARENLIELGMTGEQIEALRRSGTAESRIRIKSPQSGTVIEKAKVEGDYVATGETIYRIADLSTVWLMLDLFPEDAAAVRFGQHVEAEMNSRPGEIATGRVAFIHPTVDRQSRTVRVRVEMQNEDGRLRPGDYATARIAVPAVPSEVIYDPALAGKYISPMHPQVVRDGPGDCPICGMDLIPTAEIGFASDPLPEQEVITVPRDAVLMAGGNSVVYVETEPGHFQIRRVTVGPLTDQEAVIIQGLAAGETVATAGNFLIDSQMQLAGNPSLKDPTRAPRYPPGPLELPDRDPLVLSGAAAERFDRTYAAYFEIQRALSEDELPPPTAVDAFSQELSGLVADERVPRATRHHFRQARYAAERLGEPLDVAREAFRSVSHALLKAAAQVRGPETGEQLTHFYCPMVPGGGGDWMQPGGELANPYWGDAMYRCGERVGSFDAGDAGEPGDRGDEAPEHSHDAPHPDS